MNNACIQLLSCSLELKYTFATVSAVLKCQLCRGEILVVFDAVRCLNLDKLWSAD